MKKAEVAFKQKFGPNTIFFIGNRFKLSKMHSNSIFDQKLNKNKFPNTIFVEELGKKSNKYLFILQKH